MTVLEWPTLDLKSGEIYLNMGTGRSDRSIGPEIAIAIEEAQSKAKKLIEDRAVYDLMAVESREAKQVVLAGSSVLRCSSRFFDGATLAALVITTVGQRLEEESSRLYRQGEYLEGLALDACGINALNQIGDLVREHLTQELSGQGYKLGYSLNPGCHMIPLEEQETVFALLDGGVIGVSLTDSCLMIPVKSGSAIIALGQELALPGGTATACALCNLRASCTYSPAGAGQLSKGYRDAEG